MDNKKLSEIHRLQIRRTKAYGENDMDPDEIRAEIEELVNDMGFRRAGSGDYRVVYSDQDSVLKVAWNKLGIKENRAEYRNWQRSDGIEVQKISGGGLCSARDYLAEIYVHDTNSFAWIKMEKVETGSNTVTHEEAKKLRESFSNAGIRIEEIKPYNIGRKYRKKLDKKVPVVFDYGGT